jgi:hypothetical protein
MIKVVAVFGYSGAGKTYFCDRVTQLAGLESIHCIGHLKKDLEQLYRLPTGSLDTPSGKEIVPQGMTVSIGQLLKDLYHFYSKKDPYYSTRGLRDILDRLLSEGKGFALNGIRNFSEVELLKDLTTDYDLELSAIWVYRSNIPCLSTDLLQGDLFTMLDAHSHVLYNDLTPNVFDGFIIDNLQNKELV